MNHYHLSLPGLLLLISFHLWAGEPDTIVFKDDLSFHSNLEKVAFESLENEKGPNYIYLFVAIDDSCTADQLNGIRHRLTDQVNEFANNHKFSKAKEKKKIKIIYNDIHSKFLSKYGENYYFPEIFSGGNYNCVTASALYGLILKDLDITYTIKESFNHVYILTYPDTYSIRIETTDPTSGYLVYNDKFKEQFISFMAEAKLISQTERQEKSVDELFNEYYYKEEDIDLLELAGLQYYNKAVDLLSEEKYEEAFMMAEKSAYLHNTEKSGYMLLICLANVLDGCHYEDIRYADYIYKGARYHHYGITTDDVVDQFADVTNKLLINEYNTQLYDAYYHRIMDHLEDTSLMNEISFIYNYERGRILYNDNQYDNSVAFAEKAYQLKPRHVDARNLFVSDVLQTFTNVEDPESSLKQLNHYIERYPDLMNDKDFNTLRCVLNLGIGVDLFMSDKPQEAFEKIHDFEKIADQSYPDFSNFYLSKVLVEAYSRAASYYFRKGNSNKARYYLEQGLKYAPNSYELRSKLSSLNY